MTRKWWHNGPRRLLRELTKQVPKINIIFVDSPAPLVAQNAPPGLILGEPEIKLGEMI